jgi:hypothetical protein
MADAPRDEHEGALIDVEKLVAFGQMMDVEERAIRVWLDAMLKTGLCVNYDPTVLDQQEATRLEITPAGNLHLNWARTSFEYISAMAIVTPLLDEAAHHSIQEAYGSREWRQVASRFVKYVVAEDKMHCRLPDHSAYAGQRRTLAHLGELADNWSRPKPQVVPAMAKSDCALPSLQPTERLSPAGWAARPPAKQGHELPASHVGRYS